MKSILQISFVLILFLPFRSAFADHRWNDPVLMVGLKMPIGINAANSTETNLNFLDTGGGASVGVGLSVDIIPFTYLDLETGAYYRFASFRDFDVSLQELYFPMILKLRFPISSEIVFLIGGGTAYFHAISGKVNPTDTVDPAFGQRPISLPQQDLRNGFSLIFKTEIQAEIGKDLFLSFELGYEKAKRSLDIVTHDITIGIGITFKVF